MKESQIIESVKNDPLLVTGFIITLLLRLFLGLVIAALLLSVPALLLNQTLVFEALEIARPADTTTIITTFTALAIAVIVACALAFHFLTLLSEIIATVGMGDPFVPDNAARLTRMAWVALLVQLLTLPIGLIAVYLRSHVPSDHFNIGADFSLTGLLVVILLFILARVFKHGVAMRDDLEGTV